MSMFWILDLGFWCFDFWFWGLDFWCIFESSSHPFPLQMFDIELDFCEKLGHVAFVSSWSMKCPHVCTGLFYGAASMGNILRTPTSWFFRISLGNRPSPFRFFRGHELMGLRPFDFLVFSKESVFFSWVISWAELPGVLHGAAQHRAIDFLEGRFWFLLGGPDCLE